MWQRLLLAAVLVVSCGTPAWAGPTTTPSGGPTTGAVGGSANSEATVEGFIFDNDTEDIIGVWTVLDNVNFEFGTDRDWEVSFKPGSILDTLTFSTDENGTIGRPMIKFIIDATVVNGTGVNQFQEVFTISKGLEDGGDHVDLLLLSGDGDLSIEGGLSLKASFTTTASDASNTWTDSPFTPDITASPGGSATIFAGGMILGVLPETISGTDLTNVGIIQIASVTNSDLVFMLKDESQVPFFAITEDKSGTGSWLYNSLLIGPESTMGTVDTNIICSTNFSKIDCGAGADLGVEDDIEVGGLLYVDLADDTGFSQFGAKNDEFIGNTNVDRLVIYKQSTGTSSNIRALMVSAEETLTGGETHSRIIFGLNSFAATDRDSNTTMENAVVGGLVAGRYSAQHRGTGTVTMAGGIASKAQISGPNELGTIIDGYGFLAEAPDGGLTTRAGEITNYHSVWIKDVDGNPASNELYNMIGVHIEDLTNALTTSVGIQIDGADTYALWLGAGSEVTTAADGITFGSSADVNLYRRGANTLKTDAGFIVGGLLSATNASLTTPTITTSIAIGSTGVLISDDGDGAITFKGQSAGADEDLTWNYDDVANEVGVSSSTGVATINFGTISLTSPAPIATSTGGTLAINTITIATATGDYDLPDNCDSATGAWATLIVRDASETASLTVLASEDTIIYPGISPVLSPNDELDSPGVALDSVTVTCLESNNWYAEAGNGATWTDGGIPD